jgi:hypothetical protein
MGVAAFGLLIILVAGFLGGLLVTPPAASFAPYECDGSGGPPGIHCGCPFLVDPCGLNDDGWNRIDGPTRTAALDVYHETASSAPAQPTVGETWIITATWRAEDYEGAPSPCPCDDRVEVVTADVYWDDVDREWPVDCDGCNAAYSAYNPSGAHFIYEVDVCTTWDCFPNTAQSSQYELIVNLAEVVLHCGEGINIFPRPPGDDFTEHYLHAVEFATTEVDGGLVMDESCGLLTTVSPTTEQWYAVDLGRDAADSAFDFECPFNCSAEGPDVTITYQ